MNAQAPTPAITRVRLSQTTDANGNASMTVDGYNVQQPGMWNLFLSVQGSAIVSVLEDGNPISGGPATNGSYDGGPIYTNGNSSLTVNVTGATPNTPVSGVLRGVQSNNPADLVSFVAPGYSTVGATQDNPSALLSGGVGPASVVNETVSIPANSSVTLPDASDWFDVSGYAAVLLTGHVTASNGNTLFAQLTFSADGVNPILQTMIPALYPRFSLVIAVPCNYFQFAITNSDPSVAATIKNVTIIPLPAMPPSLDRFMVTESPASGPPYAHQLILANQNVTAGSTVTFDAAQVWLGQAIWSIGTTTLPSPTGFDATLETIDGAGDVNVIARINGPVSFPAPVLVQLDGGLARCTYHNSSGSVTQAAFVSLLATS